jgi:regulator of sigma E protease
MITGDYPNTARAIAETISLLRPGKNVMTGAQLDAISDDELKKVAQYQGKKDSAFEEGEVGWIDVFDVAQLVRPPQPIEVKVTRDGAEKTLTLTPKISSEWFCPQRGMLPQLLQRTYRAGSWWEAIKLGARQTRRDMGIVLTTLQKLIRGEVAIKHIGGPGTIAAVATGEATQGNSRLLLFLTMLGANLAILNFLPIPILDGGHMMFLAYEGIFRRPVNERVQVILSFMGLFFIVGLMLLAISLDIFRFLI